MEEWFDVVNAQDEVIGQRLRADVHQLGLLHRAVHILVFNDRGQLFLQKRSELRDCFPGKWDSSASGHLDAGEDYDHCAVRELGEEIGLHLDACPEKLFKVDACPATGQEFVWVYRCQSNGPFKLQPEEVSEGGFYDRTALEDWLRKTPEDFATGFVLVWEKFRAFEEKAV